MTDSLPQSESAGTAPIAGMPSTLDLVRETVESFAIAPSKSTVIALDAQTLIDLGVILVDKDCNAADGLVWLVKEFGEEAISRSAYYRFVPEFRQRFSGIRARYRERLARLAIDQVTRGTQGELRDVLQVHLTRLMAEKIVDTNDLAQLEGKELSTIVTMLDGWTRAGHKDRELSLKEQDSERKAAKLEADLQKANAEVALLQQRLSRLPDQLKALQKRLESAEVAAAAGKKVDAAVFAEIKRQLIALAAPAKEAA